MLSEMDKVKISGEELSSQILEKKKDYPSSPTGVEPMTLQNTGWNALSSEPLSSGVTHGSHDLKTLLHLFSLYPSHHFTYHLFTFLISTYLSLAA